MQSLPADAVVLWDLSPLDVEYFGDEWSSVIAACQASPCDMVLTLHADPWMYSRPAAATEWLTAIEWDYAAGSHLLHDYRREWFSKAFPGLSVNLSRAVFELFPDHGVEWQCSWRGGGVCVSLERGKVPEVLERDRALAFSPRAMSTSPSASAAPKGFTRFWQRVKSVLQQTA